MKKYNGILLYVVAILMCGCGKSPTPQPFVVDVVLSSKLKSNYLPQDLQQLYYPIFDAQKNIIYVSSECDDANDSSIIMNIVTAKKIGVMTKYDWWSNIRNKISGKPTKSTREGATKSTLKTLDCSELAKGDNIPDTEKCSRLTDFINQQRMGNEPKYDIILYYSENQKIASWNGSLIYHTVDSIRTAMHEILKEKPKSKFLVVYNPPSCKNPISNGFPDGITLNKTSLELEKKSSTERLKAKVYPDTIPEKNKKITWQSGDEAVAKVDSNGVVTAVTDSGSVIISAYTLNGILATCNITIAGNPQNVKTNDTIIDKKGKDNVTPMPKPTPKRIYGTIRVIGGIYKGYLLNGKPDGEGTIRYSSHTLIEPRDMKKRYAEAGQRITGQFENGHLLQGKLYDSEEKHIETIIP